MNKIYKIIWSKAKNSYVVASELTKSHTKSPSGGVISRTLVAGVLACVLSCGAVLPVYAATGGVEMGTHSIANGEYSVASGNKSTAIGYGAIATGNNWNRQQIESASSNNKQYQDNITSSTAEYNSSINDYNQANTVFQNTNTVYLNVQAKQQDIANWQTEIDTTLQPNADAANSTYITKKNDYDSYNENLSSRVNAIQSMNFADYLNDGVYDYDSMATSLKTQTEADSSFSQSLSFYKDYLQKYVGVEDVSDSLDISNTFLLPNTVSYSAGTYTSDGYNWFAKTKINNNYYTIKLNTTTQTTTQTGTTYTYTNHILPLLNQIEPGLSLVSFANYSLVYDSRNDILASGRSTNLNALSSVYTYGVSSSNLDKMLNNLSINDEETYNTYKSYLDYIGNQNTQSQTNVVNAFIQRNIITQSQADAYMSWYSSILNADKAILTAALDYRYYTYLATSTGNAQYATLRDEAKALYDQLYADNIGTLGHDSKYGNSTSTANVYGFTIDDVSSLVTDCESPIVSLIKWCKNLTDAKTVINSSSQTISTGLNAQLSAKLSALNTATTAKQNADSALAAKQQQIANRQPTEQELQQASLYEEHAENLEQAQLKMEADAQALEDANEQFNNLLQEMGNGINAIAIGTDALTSGKNAIGIGTNTIVANENAIGIGKDVIITGQNAVGIGTSNTVSSTNGLAIGNNNAVSGTNSIALGNNNVVSGANSIAIGNSLNVTDDNVVALGNKKVSGLVEGTLSNTSKEAVTGSQLYTTNQNLTTESSARSEADIALGNRIDSAIKGLSVDGNVITYTKGDGSTGSITTESVTYDELTLDNAINGTSTDARTISAKILNDFVAGKVSTETAARSSADDALDSRITSLDNVALKYDVDSSDTATLGGTNGTTLRNVKGGLLSSSSMEAVNGSQLYATNQNIAGFAADIQRNKNTISTLNTSIAAALDSVATSSLLVNTMDDIKADVSLNNLSAAGRQIIANAAANAVQEYMAAQQASTPSAPMAPMMVSSPNTLTVTDAGNGSLHVGEGSYVNGTSSIAIGVGNQVNANNSGAFGDPSIIDADESYVLGNDDRITATAKGSFIVGNGSKADAEGSLIMGSNVESTGKNGLSLGNNTAVSAENAVALGSGSVASEINTVSVGNNNLKRRITNLADGNIEEGSSDAVTGGQLYTTNQIVLTNSDLIATNASNILDNAKEIAVNKLQIATKADIDGSNIDTDAWSQKLGTGQIEEGNTGLVTGGTVYNGMMAFVASNPVQATDEAIFIGPTRGGNVVSLYNKDGESRVITGVATNSEDASSAANVGYVNAVGQNIVAGLNNEFSKVNSRMNKIGANAAAMASLTPASFEGDEKWSLAASVGHYKGATAGAVGAFYKPAENVMLNVRGSFADGENMVGGGVSVSLNKGDVPGVTKRQLATKIHHMEQTHAAEMNAMKQEVASYQQQVAELKAMVESMAASK